MQTLMSVRPQAAVCVTTSVWTQWAALSVAVAVVTYWHRINALASPYTTVSFCATVTHHRIILSFMGFFFMFVFYFSCSVSFILVVERFGQPLLFSDVLINKLIAVNRPLAVLNKISLPAGGRADYVITKIYVRFYMRLNRRRLFE